jgi:hypothetical protein
MKNLSLFGLTCLGTACGVALSLPANAANLTAQDSCNNVGSNCTSTFTELAIILDGSNSITPNAFDQQLQIYKSVFGSPNFYQEILKPLAIQQIAVSVFQFGYIPASASPTNQIEYVRQNIGWTLLDSQTSAETFANQLPSIVQMGGTRSPIGNSIAEAHNGNKGSSGLQGLRNNNFAGNYLVMDISSDGYAWFSSIPWEVATADAYNDKINAINGISIAPAQGPGGSPPVLDKIVSLKDAFGQPLIPSNPNAAWTNPSDTPGFLKITGNLGNYQQFLANKVAQETLPPGVFNPNNNYLFGNNQPQSVPEASSLWGLLSLGLLGILSKIRGR